MKAASPESTSSETLHMGDALHFLKERWGDVDDGASAHWREMHKTFEIDDGHLSGMRGFQRLTAPKRGAERFLHSLMLQPYRAVGRRFEDFRRLDALGKELASRQGRFYGLEILRQVITIAFIRHHVPNAFRRDGAVLVIGDGFGVFSSLVQMAFPDKRIVLINLRKSLFADLVYYQKVHPTSRFALSLSRHGLSELLDHPQVQCIALQADDWRLLDVPHLALAVNICSMQEMEPRVVAQYFHVMRKHRGLLFYCNNGEMRVLPDGTEVRFDRYPWSNSDRILVDEQTPWHQSNYRIRPFPRYWGYDPHRHRLAVLQHSSGAS